MTATTNSRAINEARALVRVGRPVSARVAASLLDRLTATEAALAEVSRILPRKSCLYFTFGQTCGEQGRPEPHCPPCRVRVGVAMNVAPPTETATERCVRLHDNPSNYQPCYFCCQTAPAKEGPND